MLDFEEDPNFGIDDLDVEETQGTHRISSQQHTEQIAKDAPTDVVDLEATIPKEVLDTASSQPRMTLAVATADVNNSTAEEESTRQRMDKGKAPIIEEAEQPRKISAREQA